jgi:hypothetical protein
MIRSQGEDGAPGRRDMDGHIEFAISGVGRMPLSGRGTASRLLPE